MTHTDKTAGDAADLPRSKWVFMLGQLSKARVIECAERLAENWTIHPGNVPRSGLGVLQLQEGTMGENYYLGEFPLTCVWIEVHQSSNVLAEGAANVMDGDLDYAEALAICDAVLSAKLEGWQCVQQLQQEGMQLYAGKEKERSTLLATTRVDFSMMDDEAGENIA